MSKFRFEIQAWGSDPDAGNDDCLEGLGLFVHKDQALAAFRAMEPKDVTDDGIAWLELVSIDEDGNLCDQIATRQLVGDATMARRRESAWQEERRERAYEAGMLGGCDSYNEVMGY